MLGEAFALLVWDGWPTALRIACNLTRLESFDIKESIEVSWLVVLVSLRFGFEPGLGAVLDAARACWLVVVELDLEASSACWSLVGKDAASEGIGVCADVESDVESCWME